MGRQEVFPTAGHGSRCKAGVGDMTGQECRQQVVGVGNGTVVGHSDSVGVTGEAAASVAVFASCSSLWGWVLRSG